MRDAWLGRLFVRFRDREDGRALAAVFDATARELIGVAAHLVPTVDQAEDVVQTTFQRAIEQAGRYDAEQSLKGWLYGILWREAAKLTRQERRAPFPGALEPSEPASPEDEASQSELPASVRRALARLPSPYREVLEPALLEERSAREIAAHLGRSPGTVRVQLQRGLERLRRELPSAQRELAGRRAFALLGLGPLRSRVLQHAGVASATVPAASVTFLLAQLAAVAAPPAAWASLVLAGTAAGVGVARSVAREAGSQAPGPPPAEVASVADAPLAPSTTSPGPAPLPGSAAVPERLPPAPREPRAGPRRRPAPVVDPQITGVVIDEARHPLAEVTVMAEAEGHYGYAETFTDEQGRFVFGDLAAGRWYVHADDERHARMWWQTHGVGIEEDSEEADEEDGGQVLEADLELILRAPHAVQGVVHDTAGLPVADARVTLAVEWPAGAEGPLQGQLTQEITTTTTGAEGNFEFDRLGAGQWTAVLDHPAFARTLAQFEVPGAPPRLEIEGGMTLEGLVLADGVPLADVRVEAHSTRQSHLTMGDWEVTTDAGGRFLIERVSPVGDSRLHGVPTATVTVKDDRWSSAHHRVYESSAGRLPSVTVEAFPRGEDESGERGNDAVEIGRDREGEARQAGRPFGSGTVRVRLAEPSAGAERVDVWLSGSSPELETYSEHGTIAGERSFAFERLAAGRYRLSPRNRGGANHAPETFELGEGESREVVLRPGELRLAGKITCAGQRVTSGSLRARSIRNGSGQSAQGTIAEGAYEVRGLLAGSYELLVEEAGALTQYFEVQLSGSETVLDLELPPGRIEGRLGFERASEGADFRVMVFPYGWYQESGNRGVRVDPDAEGRFRVRHLPPGDYVVSAWRAEQHVPARVVTVTSAVPVQEVELVRDAATGRLAGRITNAVPSGPLSIAALKHEPQGLRRVGYCEVDSAGRFDEEVEPGRFSLLVSNFDARAPFLLVPDVFVEAGETTELTLTLPPGRSVSIRLDAGGAWTPCSNWRLRLPDGVLPSVLFIGSQADGRRSGARAFQLPFGDYVVEADFGDARPLVREFTVVPGDGPQEILVTRP